MTTVRMSFHDEFTLAPEAVIRTIHSVLSRTPSCVCTPHYALKCVCYDVLTLVCTQCCVFEIALTLQCFIVCVAQITLFLWYVGLCVELFYD